MNEVYAAHLGWMVGNLFTRVAMQEWEELRKHAELWPLDEKIRSLQAAIEQQGQVPAELEKPLPG